MKILLDVARDRLTPRGRTEYKHLRVPRIQLSNDPGASTSNNSPKVILKPFAVINLPQSDFLLLRPHHLPRNVHFHVV